jgi:hypothetical protein
LGAAPEASTLSWSSWPALVAWLTVATCALLAWRKRHSLEALAPPAYERLLSELTADCADPSELDEVTRRVAIAELNQRLSDVSFELDVLPATYAALTRIGLASGSGLALLSFVISTELSPIERALSFAVTALAGFIGAGAIATIGRSAKSRARQIREKWDASSRDVGKALGASLDGPTAGRGNGFPA